MSKSKLLEIARNNKSHAEAGTMVLVDEIVRFLPKITMILIDGKKKLI